MTNEIITSIRKNLFGLKQWEFGKIAGVSQTTVHRWELGDSSPSLDELTRIREAAKERGLPWEDSMLFNPIPDSAVPAVVAAQAASA